MSRSLVASELISRRNFLAGASLAAASSSAQTPGDRPQQESSIEVLNPRGRVPVSLIIDDSTCLVNLNRFAVPQFRAAYGGRRYHHDWRSWPHEIPDSFVRKFGEWCAQNGVKGKYSVVPFPACVGRLDREVPGWTRREILDSIKLVQDLMMPDWDIHPEMVTHTRVIDLKTGHPYPEISLDYIENSRWSDNRSVDELASYMAYALRILKNVDLPCEGITTPGGFGTRALPQLSQATLESCKDVFQAEIPHYFRHLYSQGDESVAPRVEYASGLDAGDPRCAVSIIGCTGDWFGGWDCSHRGRLDDLISPDLSTGRMVDIVNRGEPACMVCHWTGIYFHGQEHGFRVFQDVVRRLHERFDNLAWMKLSEIARYWAAKELTRIERSGDEIKFFAPFGCPGFTVRLAGRGEPRFNSKPLERRGSARELAAGTWTGSSDQVVCFDLPKGVSVLTLG